MLKFKTMFLSLGLIFLCPTFALRADESAFDFENSAKYFFCSAVIKNPNWFISESFSSLKNMQETSKKAVKLIGHKVKYEYWNDGYGQFCLIFPETEDSTQTYALCISLQDVKKNKVQEFQFKGVTPGNRPPNGKKIAEGVVEIPDHPELFIENFKKIEIPKEKIVQSLRDFLKYKKINGEQTFILAPFTELDAEINIYWVDRNELASLSNSPDERFDFVHEPWVKFKKLEPPKDYLPGLKSIYYYLFYVRTPIANCVKGGTVLRVVAGN